MKSLIVLLMLVSSAFAQEPVNITLSISNEDWAKVSHAITRLLGMPVEGTEEVEGLLQLSDGTEVSHGERGLNRLRSWATGTITVSARIKVAPENEPIEVQVTITDTAESPDD